MLGPNAEEPEAPKPTMKKLLDGKINYKAGFGVEKGYNTRNMDKTVSIDDAAMNEINYHNRTSGIYSNTDYHALANSSFLSPAQQKKTRGFVDFDLQLFRPGLSTLNAHEKRFDPYNYFPANLSCNKPIPNVHIEK